ncbi:MAG: hypothetical protein M3217_06880, partial [Actinomycetota bacterium]|nr:hypothetical protein [Actinomycetota bacterium]
APEHPAGDFALVPDEHLGPEPGPDLAEPEDLGDARAVTVAFHALVLRMSYYDFVYQGVERNGGAWRVTFLDGAEPESLEGAIENHLEVLAQAEAARAEQRERLASLQGRLEEEAHDLARRTSERGRRTRERARQAAAAAENVERTEAELARLQRMVRKLERRLRAQEAEGGPFPVVLVVEESEGGLFVEAVETESPRLPELEATVGYTEPVDGVDSWGADYFGLQFERTGPDEGLSVAMNVFWTGPIPGRYEERCVPEIRDATNKVVWRGDETRYRYNPTPRSEAMREWVVSFGADHEGPIEDLRLEMECAWRPAF